MKKSESVRLKGGIADCRKAENRNLMGEIQLISNY